MVGSIFFGRFFCPGLSQLDAGLGFNLCSLGGYASILGGWLCRGQGGPFDLLHLSNGLGRFIFAGSVNFYLSPDRIHFAVGSALIFIIGTADDDPGSGRHVRAFVRLDFLVSSFKLFDFSFLLRTEIFFTGDGGPGR